MSTIPALAELDEILTELVDVDWPTLPGLVRCQLREELPVLRAELGAVVRLTAFELALRAQVLAAIDAAAETACGGGQR